VALISNGSAYNLSVNGNIETLVVESEGNNGRWIGNAASKDNILVGAMQDSGGLDNYFTGEIDDVVIHSPFLTIPQVQMIYNNSFPPSGNVTTINLNVSDDSVLVDYLFKDSGGGVNVYTNESGGFVRNITNISNSTYTAYVNGSGGQLRFEFTTDNNSITPMILKMETTNNDSNPIIVIDSPTNSTYLNTTINVNYSILNAAGLDSVWLSHPTVTNVSISGNHSRVFPGVFFNNVTICANNSLGNTGCTTVYFSITSTQNVTLYRELNLPSWNNIIENVTIKFLHNVSHVVNFLGTCINGACTINVSDGGYLVEAGGGNSTYYPRRIIINVVSGSIVEQEFLLMLNSSAYQKDFRLTDLTGDCPYATTRLRILKYTINGSTPVTAIVHEDYFDAERKVATYLEADAYYSLTLLCPDTTRVLGGFVASDADDVPIVVTPSSTTPGETIYTTTDWNITTDNTSITFQYSDSNLSTVAVTLLLFNNSNRSQLYLNSTVVTNTATFTYIPTTNGSVYYDFTIENGFGSRTFTGVIGFVNGTTIVNPWDDSTFPTDIGEWVYDLAALLIIGFVALLFNRNHQKMGVLVLAGTIGLFNSWRWHVISNSLLGLIVVVALIAVVRADR
jgi:hypothetical protein